ncbi:olfactory receptor 10A3-like [Tachyglossus aculeatus]|uniref:olfactory receptor 10A3-like n=1 Tax=Tachyglossus aculeatus TaxID=9261 RepID=UPI0018F7CDFA|nr:olfactory receptor 10A3-like [Tachyglossus aculeatus]
MRGNQSTVTDFILLGFSNFPKLQFLLFVVFLIIYLIILVGNTVIVFIITLEQSLHIPMYLFLRVLSILETCFSGTIVPKMLVILSTDHRTISFAGCVAQMYFILFLGGTECFLLCSMAYDRYVAICNPLHYPVLMSKAFVTKLTAGSVISGAAIAIIQTPWVFSFPFCGRNKINHLFCETPPVLDLVCGDTFLFEIYAYIGTISVVMLPFLMILLSYTRILYIILKMSSTVGRQKAFSTCASHLTSVTLFYGPANLTYLQPKASYTAESKELLSLAYALLTPLLNPLIYSLRSSEMKGALKKILRRKLALHNLGDILKKYDIQLLKQSENEK